MGANGFAVICTWLLVDSPCGHEWFPDLAARLPDEFWMHVLVNLFVLALAFVLSWVLPRRPPKNLDDLTVWTRSSNPD